MRVTRTWAAWPPLAVRVLHPLHSNDDKPHTERVWTTRQSSRRAAQRYYCQPGAEVVGGEELVAAIAAGGAGAIAFNKCLATADMASKLGRVARVGALPQALSARPLSFVRIVGRS